MKTRKTLALLTALSLPLSLLNGCALMEKSEEARWDAYKEAKQMEVIAKSLVIKEREQTKRAWLHAQTQVLTSPTGDASAAAIMMATKVAEMFSPETRAAEKFLSSKTEMPTGVLKETVHEIKGFAQAVAPAVLMGWTVGKALDTADKAVEKAMKDETPSNTVIRDSVISDQGDATDSTIVKAVTKPEAEEPEAKEPVEYREDLGEVPVGYVDD